VQRLEVQLEQTEAGLEELGDRSAVMGEHLRSVQSELKYTQQRVTSKAKEVASEGHLKALGEREAARLAADVRVLQKEKGELVDRVMGLQGQIYRASEKMDQFKARVVVLLLLPPPPPSHQCAASDGLLQSRV
jgi:chromosome segregation ATPase